MYGFLISIFFHCFAASKYTDAQMKRMKESIISWRASKPLELVKRVSFHFHFWSVIVFTFVSWSSCRYIFITMKTVIHTRSQLKLTSSSEFYDSYGLAIKEFLLLNFSPVYNWLTGKRNPRRICRILWIQTAGGYTRNW